MRGARLEIGRMRMKVLNSSLDMLGISNALAGFFSGINPVGSGGSPRSGASARLLVLVDGGCFL